MLARNRLTLRAFLWVLSLLSLSCGSGDKAPTAPPLPVMVLTTVTVSLSAITLQVGQTATANATGADQNGGSIATGNVTWSSSAPTVAMISSGGAITAVAAGQATITATAGGKTGQATLTVIPVPVASVTVTPAAATLIVGTTQQLAATTKDALGATLTGRVVAWTSSDSAKARVSATGLVTGVAEGSATITATSEGKAGTATFTVIPVPVATVTVTPPSASIIVGATQQLTAVTLDGSGNTLAGRVVTWRSAELTKATVSATGLVTAVAVGSVTITATSEGRSATAAITVLPRVSRVVLSATAITFDAIGATQSLVATPQDAAGVAVTDVTVQWTTSAASVASVTSTGVVTAVGNGSAVITASALDKIATATATVSQVVTRLALVDGDMTVVAGLPIVSPLRVRVLDRLGAAATLASGTVTAFVLSGAIAGGSSAAIALGEARFDDLRFPSAGTTRVRLSVAGGIAPIDTSVVVLERPVGVVRATLSYPTYYYHSEPGGIVRADPLIEAVDATGKLLNVSGLVRAIFLAGTGEILSGDTARMIAGSARFAALRIYAPTNRGVMLGFYSTVLNLGTADVFGSYQTPSIALRRAAAADSVVPRDALFALDIVVSGSLEPPIGMVRANVAFDSSRVALVSDSVATATGTMTRSPVGPNVASYTFTYVNATGLTAFTTLLRLRFRAKASGSARVDLLPSQLVSSLGVSYYVYYWPLSVFVRIP